MNAQSEPFDSRDAPPDLSANPAIDALRQAYSEFGEVRHISEFQINGNKGFFLVSFAESCSAINAANATGCSLFGFTAVLVDLDRLAKCASGA